MSIKVTCTKCGKSLAAPDSKAGKEGKCPNCGARLIIPAKSPAQQAGRKPTTSFHSAQSTPRPAQARGSGTASHAKSSKSVLLIALLVLVCAGAVVATIVVMTGNDKNNEIETGTTPPSGSHTAQTPKKPKSQPAITPAPTPAPVPVPDAPDGTGDISDMGGDADSGTTDKEPEFVVSKDLVFRLCLNTVRISTSRGFCMGYILDPFNGIVVANRRQLAGSKSTTVFYIKPTRSKRYYERNIGTFHTVSIHKDTDLCMLEGKTPQAHTGLVSADASTVEKDDNVFILFLPRSKVKVPGVDIAVTGKITAVERDVLGAQCFETSIEVTPKNSGSPLFNEDGEVIGMLSYSLSKYQGANIAVSAGHINELKNEPEEYSPEPEMLEIFTAHALDWHTMDCPGLKKSIKVDGVLGKIAYDPDRKRLYALESKKNTLLVISGETYEIEKKIATGNNPVDLDFSRKEGALYIACAAPATISVVDLDKLEVVNTYSIDTRRLLSVRKFSQDNLVIIRENVVKTRIGLELTGLQISLYSMSKNAILHDLRNPINKDKFQKMRSLAQEIRKLKRELATKEKLRDNPDNAAKKGILDKRIDEITEKLSILEYDFQKKFTIIPIDLQDIKTADAKVALNDMTEILSFFERCYRKPVIASDIAHKSLFAADTTTDTDSAEDSEENSANLFEMRRYPISGSIGSTKATTRVLPNMHDSTIEHFQILFAPAASADGKAVGMGNIIYHANNLKQIGELTGSDFGIEKETAFSNITCISNNMEYVMTGLHIADKTLAILKDMPAASISTQYDDDTGTLYLFDRLTCHILIINMAEYLKEK